MQVKFFYLWANTFVLAYLRLIHVSTRARFFLPSAHKGPQPELHVRIKTNTFKVFLLEKYTDIITKDIIRGYVAIEICMYIQTLKEIWVMLDCGAEILVPAIFASPEGS